MAQSGQKDLLGKLADASEEALQRLAATPGADRLVGAVAGMRDQMDALSKRVRGMEDLERRLDQLERRVDELSSTRASGSSPARKSTSASSSRKSKTSSSGSGRKSATARKSGGSSRKRST